MSDLPRLMKADCGHFVRYPATPVGEQQLFDGKVYPVYLCAECRPRLAPPIETKVPELAPSPGAVPLARRTYTKRRR